MRDLETKKQSILERNLGLWVEYARSDTEGRGLLMKRDVRETLNTIRWHVLRSIVCIF